MRPLTSLAFIGFVALATSMVAAQDAGDFGIEGRYIGQTIFASMDANDRGRIHMGDLEVFRASVFAGMDSDGNGRVTYSEFAAWDPGFAAVAESVGRADAYITASRIVFAFWDQNGDGEMTDREMRIAMTQDFRRADADHDTLLTEAEFIMGFPVIIAMRAAIRPDL
jgi:hypothetical protein